MEGRSNNIALPAGWLYAGILLNAVLLVWLCAGVPAAANAWLQVAGRLHPLLVHFPVVLWVAFACWLLLAKKMDAEANGIQPVLPLLLISLVLFTPLSALSGILLSSESGYTDTAETHKWYGAVLSFLSVVLYGSFAWWVHLRTFKTGLSVAAIAGIILAGHEGASITHGDNFIWEPVAKNSDDRLPSFEEALVFAHGIQPVINRKCVSCHNEDKQKGGLLMTTVAGLRKGGETGALWDTAAPSVSLILTRLHLPLEDEKHMPPEGKVQPTAEELQLMEEWIKLGASFTLRFSQLPDSTLLRQWAVRRFANNDPGLAGYKTADPELIQELNNFNRYVAPLANGVNGLSVRFLSSAAFDKNALADLAPVALSIAELNCSNMPLTGEMLPLITSMKNLRVLQLNNTKLQGKELRTLSALPALKKLALNGIALNENDLHWIEQAPSLREVAIGNTGLQPSALASLHNKFSKVSFLGSNHMDSVVLTLNPPAFLHKQFILREPLPLMLKHVIAGAEIRYTLDGTEPDSVHSPVYKTGMVLREGVTVKARAFKKGWSGSKTTTATFYKRMHIPDRAVLKLQPHANYAAQDAETLIDSIQSDKNFKSGRWLGYKDNPMEAWLYFDKAIPLQSVTFSSMVEVGSYIMPPVKLQVWVSENGNTFTLAGELVPAQPTEVSPGYLTAYHVRCTPGLARIIKIKAFPVFPLPAWHPGKGDKGWFFTDEVFVN